MRLKQGKEEFVDSGMKSLSEIVHSDESTEKLTSVMQALRETAKDKIQELAA